MTLPLKPARAGSRSGWQVVGAALIFLLATSIAALPSRAQDTDPFTATVKVDASADTAAKAREMARIDGQRRAFAAIVERMSAGGAPAKPPPKLDDKALTDLVASFEVANERMSAVRYLADYTFHFKPAEMRRVLGSAGISLASPDQAGKPADPASKPADQPAKPDQSGKPLILIPVYQAGGPPRLWDDPNPWRDAWERQPSATGAARIVVPMGDVGDLAAIDAAKARTGDADAIAAIARNNGGDEAVVALAAIRGPAERPTGLDVTLRRYRTGRLVDSRSDALTVNPGESGNDLLGRAVAAIASDIKSGWKKEPAARYDQEGTLTAVLPISSLDDWLRARERLSGVPAIRKVAMMALSRQEVTIEIGYAGSIEQLRAALAEINLDLVRGDPLWRLARTGPGRTP